MVTKSRKNIQTVEINKDTYRRLKIEAWNKHYNTKEYINEILKMILSKRDFLDIIAPNLTIVGSQENSVTLLDSRKKELFEIFMKDLRLWCEKDNTTDCLHTLYLWAIPEVGKLFDQRRIKRTGKKEGQHQQRTRAIELMV